MPDIGVVLRGEISRLARKELRSTTLTLKRMTVSLRRDIASLKRTVSALEQENAVLKRQLNRSERARPANEEATVSKLRFSAKGLISLRKRLDLSREQFAVLAGTSAQSIYKWEREGTTPQAAQLAKLAALRGLGKREAAALLEQRSGG